MGSSSNLILGALPDGDRAAVEAILQPGEMRQHDILYDIRDAITHVWFPVSGAVSLVVPLATGEVIETAMVGRDGVIGASAALDGRISMSRAVAEIGGRFLRCPAKSLAALLPAHPLIGRMLSAHEQVLFAHVQQTAACNITHLLPNRLARWLLRARDLHGSDDLPLTQEYVAEMLGVRRTSVSLVANTLQQAGFIVYRRGHIRITNGEGLEETACECYQTVKLNYDSLRGAQLTNAAAQN